MTWETLWTNPTPWPPEWLVPIVLTIGLVVGVLSGLFGVGGGFLITPLLVIVCRLNYPIAVGTGLCQMLGAGAGALPAHRKLGNVEIKAALIMVGGSLAGVLLGKEIQQALKGCFAQEAAFTITLHCLFLALMALVAVLVWREPKPDMVNLSLLQRLPIGPNIHIPTGNLADVSLPGLAYLGVLVGVLTGLLGVGGGVLLVPALVIGVGLTPHAAVGTSLVLVCINAAIGTTLYAMNALVNLPIALGLLAGSTIGAQIGAIINQRIGGRKLRRGFVAVVGLAMLIIIVDILVTWLF